MKRIVVAAMLSLYSAAGFAAQDVAGAAEGIVKSVDRAGRLAVVETADGAKHTFHYSKTVTVHVGDGIGKATDDSLHGIDVGSKVIVHYTASAGRETAQEFDLLGDGGLKAVKGTVKHVDRGARRLSIATADGTVQSMKATRRAIDDFANDVAKGTRKGATVTVYYTEDSGKKTAHFIGKVI